MKIGKKQDVIKDYITNTNKIATAKPIKKFVHSETYRVRQVT